MFRSTIFFALTSTALLACSAGSESDISASSARTSTNADSVVACASDNSDVRCPAGDFAVACADGRREVASASQVESNDICPPPATSPPPACVQNSAQGAPWGTSVETLDLVGTATPEDSSDGPAQALRLTIRGVGVRTCWSYDRCSADVDGITNLWGQVGYAASTRDHFEYGSDRTDIQFLSTWDGSDVGPGPITLYMNGDKTHFTGEFRSATGGPTFAIDLAVPYDVVACAEVPNCTWQSHDGQFCGADIDGEPNVIYDCEGGTARVASVCTNACEPQGSVGHAVPACDD